MSNELDDLLTTLKKLEAELVEEWQIQQDELVDEFRNRQHKQYLKSLFQYLKDAPLKNILTVPVIWICLFPALLMDFFVSLYQFICFPVYGIPKVKRQDYLVFDRQNLNYLNLIEKINCFYCSYFSGLINYLQEIVARTTEQYWCPIKHAGHLKRLHGRYHLFMKYGDGKQYRENIEKVRRDFSDLP